MIPVDRLANNVIVVAWQTAINRYLMAFGRVTWNDFIVSSKVASINA